MPTKTMQTFTCTECHKDFTCLGIASRPHRFCANCKKIHIQLHNADRMMERRARPKIVNSGKSPYTVIRHDDPAGAPFRAGAHFAHSEFSLMVRSGIVEGIVVRRGGHLGGGVFVVQDSRMVEVRE